MSARGLGLAAVTATGLLVAGCSGLLPKPAPTAALFALDAVVMAPALVPQPTSPALRAGPTLVVHATQSAAGFDSARIVYTRKPHQLEHYAYSEWVDTPARMLAPLIVAALSGSAAFGAVVLAPSAAAGDLRLETELVRLQHEFGAVTSRVRLAVRATLTDSATRRVLARQDFEVLTDAPTEDAYGGVIAANQAAGLLLRRMAAFCADAARQWQPAGAAPAPGLERR
jgi:cholesterol transport system auxiliary component